MKTIDELIERIESTTTVIRNAFQYDVSVVSLPKEDFDDLLYYLKEYKKLTGLENWLYDTINDA